MVTHNAFQNLIISFAPGERVFTEGEVGTTMFIVQSGRVRLFREGGGKTVAIAEMEKGDFFGEMSLLEATPRNMSAEAVDSVELIEINSTTFDRMIRSNIEIAVRMLRKLSGRLQKAESLLGAQRAAQAGDVAHVQAAAASAPAGMTIAAAPALRPSKVPAAAAAVPSAAPAGAPAPSVKERPAPFSASSGLRSPSPPASPSIPASGAAAARPAVAASAAASAAAPPGSLSATRPPASVAGSHATAARPAPPVAGAPPARHAPGQGARLVSENGETVFPISGEALVGRYDPVTETQPEVDLTLIDIKRSVSRRHARISTRDGVYFLTEEVGALNGTFVNGVKLTTGKPAPLSNEDRVSLGTVNLVFRS